MTRLLGFNPNNSFTNHNACVPGTEVLYTGPVLSSIIMLAVATANLKRALRVRGAYCIAPALSSYLDVIRRTLSSNAGATEEKSFMTDRSLMYRTSMESEVRMNSYMLVR